MRVPERNQQLAEEVVVRSTEVELRAWQAHIMKHAFGLGVMREGYRAIGRRYWNYEGWDSLPTPVITEDRRVRFTRAILALEQGGQQCKINMLAALETEAPPVSGRLPCYECPSMLALRCNQVTLEVGRGYAACVDDSLAEFEDSAVVNRQELAGSLVRALQTKNLASIATVGALARGSYGLRINRPDGIRIEAREDGTEFVWRTTYGKPVRGLADCRAHLLDHLSGVDRREPLSGMALVPRLWWENLQP